METKLVTGFAMTITALLMHHLSPAIADDHTTRDLNDDDSPAAAGFSLQLVAIPNGSGHTFRRGSDGFLYSPRSLSTSSSATNPNRLGAVVQVGSGAGKQELILKVSATSSPTWLQCKPCKPMAPQMHPLFNPGASPTYRVIKATDPMCPHPPYYTEPNTGMCFFRLAGDGGIWAKGFLSIDHMRVNFGAVDQSYTFGCSHITNRFDSEGTASGVLATSRAPTSFVTQAAARGMGNFSYCLSGEAGGGGHGGSLRFGADVPRSPRYRTTGILPVPVEEDSGYHVKLVGVSLGDRRLGGVRPEMLARRGDGEGGCVVDLGTPVTVMVEAAHRVVEEAVWSDLERHGAERAAEQAGGYGLCVRATEAIKGHLQPLSLHFAGEEEEEVTLVVSPKQLFLMMDYKQAGIACLAMVPGRRTIIGALQQVDTRFVFDLKENKLFFAPESVHPGHCSGCLNHRLVVLVLLK